MDTILYNTSHNPNSKTFSETQEFGGKNIFKYLLILPAIILLTSGILWYLKFHFFWILLIPGGALALVFGILHLIFHHSSMVTVVDRDGISVQWIPLRKTPRKFSWNEIQSLRQATNPRPGMSGSGWSATYGQLYTMGNAEGIQLIMKNGNRVFIGSNEPMRIFDCAKQYFSHP